MHGDQDGNSPHTGSKRSAQHANYHNAKTKRRKEGAERAAKVQKHATQLVQQLAAPDGQSVPQETSGTLAKAEDRQNTYNISIESKPWASGNDGVSHAVDPTAGLPMQSGHYSDTETSGGQPSGEAPQDAAADGSTVEQPNSEPSSDHDNGETKEGEDISEADAPVEQTNPEPSSDHGDDKTKEDEQDSKDGSPVEQTNSEPSSDHGDDETKEDEQHSKDGSPVEQTNSEPSSDHAEGDKGGEKPNKAGSQSPPSSGGGSFSCTQDKSAGQSSHDKDAIKDRQMEEQTHQNRPQNRSESGKRYVASFSL